MRFIELYWKHSLARKLLTYVFSLYFIITLTGTFAHMYFEYLGAEKRVKESLKLFELMIQPVLSEALWNFDEQQIESTIKGLTKSNIVIGVKVFDDTARTWLAEYYLEKNAQGEEVSRFASSSLQDKKSGNNPNQAISEEKTSALDPKSFITHSFDIYYFQADGVRIDIGTAFLYSSSGIVFDQVKGGFFVIIANAIFKTLSLWFLFLTLGYRILTRPLKALTEATYQVRQGNLNIKDLQKDTYWETELDSLTTNFNHMIAQIKKTRHDLEQSKSRLNEIIDSMPSVIIVISDKGFIRGWNGKASDLTNKTEDEVLGKKLEEVFPPFISYLPSVEKALSSWGIEHCDNIVFSSEKNATHYDLMIYPIESGEKGVVLRLDDITTRLQMESAMVQNEKLSSVGSLAAGMAHEINNPLGAILQGAQNITRRLDNSLKANVEAAEKLDLNLEKVHSYMQDRKILRFLEGIREAGERAAKIVANLLQFSRKTEANKTVCSLIEIVDKSIELARTDYDLKKKTDFRRVQIITDYKEDMPAVLVCSMEIEQVILNLLKNAGQAMKGGEGDKHIILKMRSEGDYVVLDIIDNGPGMQEDVLKRIFEPFFTTKPVGEGTGLGLSVSYGIIVKSHQGQMSVTSEVGVGTHFVIKLPIASEGEDEETN